MTDKGAIKILIKRDDSNTIKEVVERNTGMSASDFFCVNQEPWIKNLTEAVIMIKNHTGPIFIIGDYDADGITSSYIMYTGIMKYLEQVVINGDIPSVKVRVPLRFSEGYGLSEKIIDEVDSWMEQEIDNMDSNGLIITVDNGIAAHAAIKKAKKKGLKVIVTDHHLPVKDDNGNIIYPAADIIIDPSAEDESEFHGYCGAGIAYRIVKELLPENEDTSNLLVMASIGTVADVMELKGANRWLVKEGLRLINRGCGPFALKEIIRVMNMEHIVEDDYGFRIGPIFNAASRLMDDGAMKVIEIMLNPHRNEVTEQVEKLVELNNMRKKLTQEALEKSERKVTGRPIVVYEESVGEGIIGLVAGKFCEKYACPAIIFTKNEDGSLKGSGRSIPEVHLKDTLDKVAQKGLILHYGGHAGAAGLSIEEKNLEEFTQEFIKACGEIPEKSEDIFYDLDLKVYQVQNASYEMSNYAPFGEGNDKIKICLEVNIPSWGISTLGSDNQHFKIKCEGIDIMGFYMAQQLLEDMPTNAERLRVVGTIGENWYKGTRKYQLQVEGYEFI